MVELAVLHTLSIADGGRRRGKARSGIANGGAQLASGELFAIEHVAPSSLPCCGRKFRKGCHR
jgi:hypothetical protein